MKKLISSRPWVLIYLLAFLPACFHNGDRKLALFYGATQDDVRTWDPARASDEASLEYLANIYETLYQYDYLASGYRLIPLLAASMPKFSTDFKTVTISIRKDVKFQDDPCFKETSGKGRELKAKDFVYGIKRLALPRIESPGFRFFDGKLIGFNLFRDRLTMVRDVVERTRAFSASLEGVVALDDYTLQLKLLKPYPSITHVLTMQFTAPIPEEAVHAYGGDEGLIINRAIGTGPFRLKKWVRSRRIELEKNPTFREERYPSNGGVEIQEKGFLIDSGKLLPMLDGIIVDVVRTEQAQWIDFLQGRRELISLSEGNFPRAIVNQVNLTPELAAKGIRLSIHASNRFYYLSFNMLDKILGPNKYLRQALSAAVDRDKMIRVFTNGRGKKMTHSLPPGLRDRPEAPRIRYDYDVNASLELLKKAGYPGGRGLPTLSLDLNQPDSVSLQIGDFLARQFGRIGVTINMIPNTLPAYLEKLRSGNIQIAYSSGELDFPDAENIFRLVYGPNKAPGPNISNFDHPEMNLLYEKVSAMPPGEERATLIRRMDSLLQEESPWAFLYYNANYELTQPWLLNHRNTNIILGKYKYYRIDKDIQVRYQETR